MRIFLHATYTKLGGVISQMHDASQTFQLAHELTDTPLKLIMFMTLATASRGCQPGSLANIFDLGARYTKQIGNGLVP